MDGCAGGELDNVGFDVEHGGGVDGVEAADRERQIVQPEQFTGGDAEPMDSRFGTLGEDADAWLSLSIAGVS